MLGRVRSAGIKTYLYHWVKALRELSPGAIRTFLAPNLERLEHGAGGPREHPAKIAVLLALNRLPRAFWRSPSSAIAFQVVKWRA